MAIALAVSVMNVSYAEKLEKTLPGELRQFTDALLLPCRMEMLNIDTNL